MNDSQKIPKKKAGRPANRVIIPRIRHSKTEREKAIRYYILGLTLPEISKLLDGIPIRTLEKWQLSDKWTELRNPENIRDKVLQLFESGKSRKRIAEIVGRGESTVYRWIKEAKEAKQKGQVRI